MERRRITSMKFEGKQKEAYEFNLGNCLVGAGAGSGKTAILTSRIRRIISEKLAKVEDLLVLTFTNKAAAEMKQRTFKELCDVNLIEEAAKVDSSDITTFDSFFLGLIKQYRIQLALPKDIAPVDESILLIKEKQILKEVIEEYARNNSEPLKKIVHNYCLKNINPIGDLILKLLKQSRIFSDENKLFNYYLNHFFTDESFDQIIQSVIDNIKERAKIIEVNFSRLDDCSGIAIHSSFVSEILGMNSYDDIYHFALSFVLGRNKSKTESGEERTENDKGLFSCNAEIIKQIKSDLSSYGDYETAKADFMWMKEYTEFLIEIAKTVQIRLNLFKKANNLFTFNDISKLARSLLDDPLVRESLKSRYKFIMIDEYQDTSESQQEFIDLIENDNVFCVGDIKQSIYAFRKASPRAFSEKFQSYGKEIGGHLITLSKNFRSRCEVIDFVNSFFHESMSNELGEVEYDKNQELEAANVLYNSSSSNRYKEEMLTYPKGNAALNLENEIQIIINDIISKYNSGFEVFDKETQSLRPCKFSDFAILIDRKTNFPEYAKQFTEYNIPLTISDDENIRTDHVYLTFVSLINLLALIDKETNEEIVTQIKHNFLSVGLSYLFRGQLYSDQELIDLIRFDTYKESSLFKKCFEFKQRIKDEPLNIVVEKIFEEFPFIDNLYVLKNIKGNYQKLLNFQNIASDLTKLGYRLDELVEYFANVEKFDISFKTSLNESKGDSVKLMSIHASKGLQFKIIYFPGMEAAPNLHDINSSYIVSSEGISIPGSEEKFNHISIASSYLKRKLISSAISERMRLFYVALTRAEEKIIFVKSKEPNCSYYKVDRKNIICVKEKEDKDGKITIEYKLTEATKFSDFIYLSQSPINEKEGDTGVNNRLKISTSTTKKIGAPTLKSIISNKEEIIKNKASKDVDFANINYDALSFGTKLHRLLQLSDIKNHNCDFIKDPKEKRIIEKVLGLELFKDLERFKVFKEYKFKDSSYNVDGIIDLLMVDEHEAKIVDYKTYSIEDEDYKAQLDTYKRYVERVFKKPARIFLVSILGGTYKELVNN